MIDGFGSVLCDNVGRIVYGKNNTILWKDCEIKRKELYIPKIPIRVIIRWNDPNVNVVTSSFWKNLYSKYGSDVLVGYKWHGSSGQETYPIWKDGYGAYWTPYTADETRKDCGILCTNEAVEDVYEIHLRQWQGAQSMVSVIVTNNDDQDGVSKYAKRFDNFMIPTSVPGYTRSEITDAGFMVYIKEDGTFDRIEEISEN